MSNAAECGAHYIRATFRPPMTLRSRKPLAGAAGGIAPPTSVVCLQPCAYTPYFLPDTSGSLRYGDCNTVRPDSPCRYGNREGGPGLQHPRWLHWRALVAAGTEWNTCSRKSPRSPLLTCAGGEPDRRTDFSRLLISGPIQPTGTQGVPHADASGCHQVARRTRDGRFINGSGPLLPQRARSNIIQRSRLKLTSLLPVESLQQRLPVGVTLDSGHWRS